MSNPNKKFSSYSEKDQELIGVGIKQQKINAYAKHPLTGAIIPIDPKLAKFFVENKSESIDLITAERKFNRRYFTFPMIEQKWNMDGDKIQKLLEKYQVPLFALAKESKTNPGHIDVNIHQVCIFEEYVFALEKKEKIKAREMRSKYKGYDGH